MVTSVPFLNFENIFQAHTELSKVMSFMCSRFVFINLIQLSQIIGNETFLIFVLQVSNRFFALTFSRKFNGCWSLLTF